MVKPHKEINESTKRVLNWVLWHHQGGSSIVGQSVRELLGMRQFDEMSKQQIADAREIGRLLAADVISPPKE